VKKKTNTKPVSKSHAKLEAVHVHLHARRAKVVKAINDVLASHGIEARLVEMRVAPKGVTATAFSAGPPNPCPNGGTPTVVCRKVGPKTVCEIECL
jgi:hypothetical protein